VSKLNMIPRDAREVYCNEEGEPIAFCPKESIGLTDVMRAQFYLLNKERLAQLAKRAKEKGPTFGVICIDVSDRTFSEVVEELMPGHDWAAEGPGPVARGVVPDVLLRSIAECFYPACLSEFSNTAINIMVCAAGGISVSHPEAR